MSKYVNEDQARKAICNIGDKMYMKGFVAANDGNISLRLSNEIILVTPAGVSKGSMQPNSLVKMNFDGTVLEGRKPSSEVKMHIRVYKENPAVNAVIHAHPPASTAFAIARIPLDRPIMSESILTLGVVPVAEYALPGTEEVPISIVPYINKYNAVLLANHGLLTWGVDLTQAMHRLESAEQYSDIVIKLKQIGNPAEFTKEQINDLISIREELGIKTGGYPRIA